MSNPIVLQVVEATPIQLIVQPSTSGGASAWGDITGTLSDQTDLQAALNAKAALSHLHSVSDVTSLQAALDGKQDEATVVSSNTTAANDGVYTVVASATFTDPSPTEGKGFVVFVRNGTATIGGTAYAVAGTLVYRVYHSGAWANYSMQQALGYTAENVANKKTDLTDNSDTYYPTQKAVKTAVDGKISKNVGATYTTNTITTVTAAEYAAIGTPDANTLYFIV